MTDEKKSPGRPKKVVENKEFSGIKIIMRTFHDGTPLNLDAQMDSNLVSVQQVEQYVSSYLQDGWSISPMVQTRISLQPRLRMRPNWWCRQSVCMKCSNECFNSETRETRFKRLR